MPLSILLAAPHRLPFLVGTANLLLLGAWWLIHLAALAAGVPSTAVGNWPASMLHGPAMLALVFPPFVFGFLLTVFPRWMGYPDLSVRAYGPVGAMLAAASAAVLIGLSSARAGAIVVGLVLEAIGCSYAIICLVRVVLRNTSDGKPRCWHAWSALLALVLGLAALIMAALAIHRLDPLLLGAAIRISIAGYLVPLFLTVAHRMVPFFAGSVVKDYVRWRPDWLLALIWVLLLASLAGSIAALPSLVMASNGAMALVCMAILWKWWPRGPAPGLLKVLFWSLAWTPAAFLLQALALTVPRLGRAPDHAMLIGFCASMLVAMVTRVTHGHSGRTLQMSRASWLAFFGLQATALLRLTAVWRFEAGDLLVITAAVFLAALIPWGANNLSIYSRPRMDGKDG